ncbi:MAG: long-chain-fatty-acid--CoA ligase [Planctomycetes bacterium]|nr:long-chain-fatty-acid--CoA ligase [Planctomycetota bacterium]
MQLATILARAEALYPDQIAVVDGAKRVSYRELAARVRSLAAALEARGVGIGTRVACLEVNSLAHLETYFACAELGAVLCPLNIRLALHELVFIVGDAGARVLLAGPTLAERASELIAAAPFEHVIWLGPAPAGAVGVDYQHALATAPRGTPAASVAPDAIAQLYYTSGTTGQPKGVMLTHANVWLHALATVAELGLDASDAWAHVAPMFHLADAWATFAITWVGGRHVMLAKFEEQAVFNAIERERVTITNLIPTMLNRLVRFPGAAQRDMTSMRRILSGGAPIAPEVVREIMRVFRCEYVQTYGMTETSPYLTLSLLKPHLATLPAEEQFHYRAKTGRAFLAVELEVVGDDGRPVARDGRSVGEIRARGPTVTPGYWKRPEETARAFVDGWLCTGDLATIDAEGYLQIVDRKKDMIISGGEKVYSTEVEHVLYEHPAVLEAAVFGLPDADWGEAVCAAVALRGGARATERELIDFCRERLTHYKCPRRVEFHAELPKTGTAKIQKRLLRERALHES